MKRKEITINQDDLGNLCICAIRYCQGRQTYMPELIMGICKRYLPMIPDEDVNVMIDDCGFQERMHLYGDERIDKPGWIRWRDELLKEKARRASV